MDFLVSLFNHSPVGQESLKDVTDIVGQQLRCLGHQCERRETKVGDPLYFLPPGRNGYNLIVEGFTPEIIEVIAIAHAEGRRFICLATEEPTPKGFNHGTQREMIDRQRIFPEAAKYLDGILHLVPGKRVTNWYNQFAPTAYIELGYSPAMIRPQYVVEPTHNLGFFGSLTPRRKKLLTDLSKFCGTPVQLAMDFKAQDARDRLVQQCKIILQVRKFEEMGLVSSSRCCTTLFNGRPVIAEAHDEELSHPWDKIVTFSKNRDHFFLQVKLALSHWRQLHAEQFARFQSILTPELCVGRALEQIGIR